MNPTGISTLAVVPIVASLMPILYAAMAALGGLLLSLFRPSAVKKGLILLWRQKAGILLLITVVLTGLHFAKRSLWPGTAGLVTAAERSEDDWPMFRGGPERRGAVPGSAAPIAGDMVWNFTAERTFFSSPAVVSNRVYAVSACYETFKDSGAIYCLDADTGGVVWQARPEKFRATFSSPSVFGRYLVCGEGLHYTKDARVVCLDLAQKGKLLWSYRTQSHVESTPCIEGGRVYVGAGDDGYYCFELDPDAAGQARVVWHASGERYPDAETSPVVQDGRVYVGLGMAGNAICCLKTESGEELWRVSTPYPVFGPPALSRGKLFVGMGNGNFVEHAEQVRTKELEKLKKAGASEAELIAASKNLRPIGEVWCLDAESGKVEWKHTVGRTVLGAVVAGDERLYFGSRDGKLYALTYDGREAGSWNAHTSLVTSPALTETHVYVVTETGRLYGLDARSLEPVWEVQLGAAGPFFSSPAVARGHVYVGSQNDGLLCVGEPSGNQQAPLWAGPRGDAFACGWVVEGPLAERGAFSWRFPAKPEEGEGTGPLKIVAPLASLHDALYAPVQGERTGLVCLVHDPQAAGRPVEAWFFATAGPCGAPVATSTQIFFASGGAEEEAGGRLVALDAATGSPCWSRALQRGATGRMALTRAHLLLEDGPGALSCLDHEGRKLWSRKLGTLGGEVCASDSMVLVARQEAPSLLALDLPTGRTLWEAGTMPATTGPVVHQGRLYVGTREGLKAHRLVNGEEQWAVRSGAVMHAVAVLGPRAAYVTAEGTLTIVDLEAQRISIELPGNSPEVAPVLCRDAVLFAGQGGIFRWGFEAAKPVRWMETSWLGAFTTPLLLDRSHLYFGTAKGGLVCARGKSR